jgi:hypothetical protein
MDKTLIAQTVANKLFATETAVDTAIVEASKLMGGLVEARQEMRLSAVVGDDAVAKVAAALAALAEARKAVVEAHHELAEVKLRVGIRTKLIGVTDKSAAATHEPAVARRHVG